MKTLLVLNDPAYGTERSYNGLRLAGTLARREDTEVRVFLNGTRDPEQDAQVPAAASVYDRWFDTGWGRYAFKVERAALQRAAGPLQGRLLVDVGGRFTQALQQRGARTVGVDLDPDMLAVAAQRTAGPWLVADAARLPLRDHAVDVAVTMLEFVADPAQVLAELARITKPGGRLVVAALNRTSLWGLAQRRRLRRPPWRHARLLTRRRLLALGSAHGGARPLPALGAFRVLVVDRR